MKIHELAHLMRQATDCIVYGQISKMHELIDQAHEISLEMRYSKDSKEYHANDDEVIVFPSNGG